jgi:poly(hydroxyalkanoate) depolymerase family esterase
MLESLLTHLPGPVRRALDTVGLTHPPGPPGGGGVEEVAGFGANPGALTMKLHVPAPPPRAGAPLLVLLHGCGQDAVRFAEAAGWTALADRLGAPLLLPEQASRNNPGRCFNWFEPGDNARDAGEVLSIRQMTEAAIGRFDSDRGRVFVAGLSAGGSMAAALLAAYPEVFAGGAVVAGLPVGCATDVGSAMSRMRTAGADLGGPDWAARVRAAAPSGYAGRWPRLSIWQGGADRVVDPANAVNLEAQWVALHGLGTAPTQDLSPRPGLRRRVWREAVELWTIEGMAHGYPVAHPSQEQFVLAAGIDATAAIARFWGLLPAEAS